MNESPARASDHSWSLRNRLLTVVGLAIAAAWLTGGVAVYFAVSEESSKMFDQRIMEVARVLMSYAHLEIDARRRDGRDLTHIEPPLRFDNRYIHQIFSEKYVLLLRTSDAPIEPMAPLGQFGFDTRIVNGERMRTFVEVSSDGDEVIIIAEPLRYRQAFVGTFHTTFLLTLLASLPLLLAGTWWMLRRALRSVGEAADQIVNRSAGNLGPIEVRSPPNELKPILKSTNELLARFAKALDAEHRLTAAAAHELRTPLAAVKVQAQVALRTRTRAELTDALHSLEQCVDRASRMLEQLLTLARLESMIGPQAQRVMVNLDAVTAGVLQDLTPLLKQRRIRITTALAPAHVKGIEFGLAVLMRNLIDNAARHSPPGSEVHIETGEDATHTFAMVRDNGPGIPECERTQVFQRFYRHVNSNSDGPGIGLSIVQTVLSVHQAQIDLGDAEEGGLSACVRFPKEDSPTSGVGSLPIKLSEKLSTY